MTKRKGSTNMTITYLEQEQIFHLQSKDMSYIIQKPL